MTKITNFKNWADIYNNEHADDFVRNEFLSNYALVYGKETMINNNQDYWDYLNDYDNLFNVMEQIDNKKIEIGQEFWLSSDMEVITDLEMIDVINENLDFNAMHDYINED